MDALNLNEIPEDHKCNGGDRREVEKMNLNSGAQGKDLAINKCKEISQNMK